MGFGCQLKSLALHVSLSLSLAMPSEFLPPGVGRWARIRIYLYEAHYIPLSKKARFFFWFFFATNCYKIYCCSTVPSFLYLVTLRELDHPPEYRGYLALTGLHYTQDACRLANSVQPFALLARLCLGVLPSLWLDFHNYATLHWPLSFVLNHIILFWVDCLVSMGLSSEGG